MPGCIKNFDEFVNENKSSYDENIGLTETARNTVMNFFDNKEIVSVGTISYNASHDFLYDYIQKKLKTSKKIKSIIMVSYTWRFYEFPFKVVAKYYDNDDYINPYRFFILKTDADKIIEDNKLEIGLTNLNF